MSHYSLADKYVVILQIGTKSLSIFTTMTDAKKTVEGNSKRGTIGILARMGGRFFDNQVDVATAKLQ